MGGVEAEGGGKLRHHFPSDLGGAHTQHHQQPRGRLGGEYPPYPPSRGGLEGGRGARRRQEDIEQE